MNSENRVASADGQFIDLDAVIRTDISNRAFSIKNIYHGLFENYPDSLYRTVVTVSTDFWIRLPENFYNILSLLQRHVNTHAFSVAEHAGLDRVSVLIFTPSASAKTIHSAE